MDQENSSEKPFWDHLDELRMRVMRCLWALLIASLIAYYFREPILGFLKAPLFAALPVDKQNLYFTGLFESFLNHLKVSVVVGIFGASPYFFYQFWAFVAPGLYKKEQRLVVPFILAATVFFVAGAAFAYYVVFPQGFRFFIEYGEPQDVAMITVKEYFNLLLHLFLLFGLSFEFPVILVLLAKIGLINQQLLIEHRRTAIIGIAVVCAFCAPPDVLSMIVMMIPLYIFYECAIFVIGFMNKEKKLPDE